MMRVWPYSGWIPAKTTVPGAGDFTAVPMGAPMSRPLWNSDLDDQGDTRPPKPELTGPRSCQREGRAARPRGARTRNRASGELSERGALTPELEVVTADDRQGNGSGEEHAESDQDDPSGKSETDDAPSVAMHDQEIEFFRCRHAPSALQRDDREIPSRRRIAVGVHLRT